MCYGGSGDVLSVKMLPAAARHRGHEDAAPVLSGRTPAQQVSLFGPKLRRQQLRRGTLLTWWATRAIAKTGMPQ
jgi:hypothetical protein